MSPTDPHDQHAGAFPLVDRDTAMSTRRAVLGDEHVDAAMAATTDLTAPFQDLATRVAWGGLWSRDGLAKPDRSLVTIAILAALGRTGELRMHLRSALMRTGVNRDELVEVLLHVAVYAGLPAANEAFAILSAVADEVGTAGATPTAASTHPDHEADAARSGHPGLLDEED